MKKPATALKIALKRREPRRASHEEEYRLLLNSTADGIFGLDLAGNCTFSNTSCQSLLGYESPEELMGKSIHALAHHSHPDGAPYSQEECRIYQSFRKGERLHADDEVFWRKEGTCFPAEYWSQPMVRGGRVIGAVVTFMDITKRKKVERALRESEEKFREFAESIHEVFWMMSADFTQVLYVSPAYEEIWGRTCESLYREPKTWFETLHPEDAAQTSLARQKQIQGEALESEYRIVRPDGSVRWIRDRSFPVRDKSGQIIRMVGIAKDVSEWKRAGEALRKSQFRFRRLVESNVLGVFTGDTGGRIVEANEAFLKMLGHNSEDLGAGAIRWDHLTPPEFRHVNERVAEQLRTTGVTIPVETEFIRKDGSRIPALLGLASLDPSAGQAIGFMLDLTEQKRAERAVRDSEMRFRLLFEHNMAGVLSSTMDGAIVDCNHSMVEMLGYSSRGQLTEMTMQEVYSHPAGHQAVLAHLKERGGLSNHEVCLRRRDGSPLWAVLNLNVVQTGDEAHPLLQCTVIDISERKRAERALQQSEERSRLLFKTIPHPIWVYDLETLSFIEVNDAAVDRYGYSREEFLRMKITDIRPPEEVARLKEVLHAPRPARQSSGQWKHRKKDGTDIDVEISSHLLEFAGRKAVLVVSQDVTERKHLEIELRHAQKLEAVGGLAAGIAHEINTPIQFVGDNTRFLQDAFGAYERLIAKYRELHQAAVAGPVGKELIESVEQAETVEEAAYLAEEVPKALAQTLDGVNRVATIVRAMKEFAHPSHGEKKASDLNKALGNTLIVARNEVKYVADVETDFGDLPTVICNLGDINQVFLNLLVNAAHAIGDAVKGTDQRGVIRVKTWKDNEHVVISIGDTGCGIPENIRNRIFDPFFTTKEVGRGTGQGLAIARSIVVEKHHGSLTFETELGHGTTFYIRLPMRNGTADQGPVSE